MSRVTVAVPVPSTKVIVDGDTIWPSLLARVTSPLKALPFVSVAVTVTLKPIPAVAEFGALTLIEAAAAEPMVKLPLVAVTEPAVALS